MDLTWSYIADKYCEVCLRASRDDSAFSVFRIDPIYKQMVEHPTQEHGRKYLDKIKKDNPDLLNYFDKFKTSDKFGSPQIYDFEGLFIAPSTLRDIKVLSDLIKYFGNLNQFKIAEIGGGYGGLCKIIKDMFDVNYHMIDLLEVNLLAERFLMSTGKNNIRFSTWNMLQKEDYDLIIAVGSFTEMNREIQDYYNEMIIKNSQNGYMVGSITLNPNNCYQIADYKKMGEVVFTKEDPNTHPTNFIMYWNAK